MLYSKDVVTFAQSMNLYPKTAPAAQFSFSDVYDPVSFTGARLAEARVFNLFNAVSDGAFNGHLDYAQGYNLTNRMSLFAKASMKLTVNDTMRLMRTHFEGTWFDTTGTMRDDVGAGSGHSAYRWRPLIWDAPATYTPGAGKSTRFVNERTIGVQQTAWNFVASSRAWLPAPFQAIMYWGPDDSSTAVRVPVWGGSTSIPLTFADPVGQEPAAAVVGAPVADARVMNLDSAFWVWNLVANMCYGSRYNATYPIVLAEIIKYQDIFFANVAAEEKTLVTLYDTDPVAAVKQATKFVVATGDKMTSDWRNFWMSLFSRFRDGFTITAPVKRQCKAGERVNCTSRSIPIADAQGYNPEWYGRIIADGVNEAHYGVPATAAADERKMRALDKRHPR